MRYTNVLFCSTLNYVYRTDMLVNYENIVLKKLMKHPLKKKKTNYIK